MVDYVDALKRPFSDLKKLLIAVLMSIFPIVNFIFQGYLLDVAENSMKRKNKLPEWDNLGDRFIQGLISIVINFMYAIPMIIFTLYLVLAKVLLVPEVSDLLLSSTTRMEVIKTFVFGMGLTYLVPWLIAGIFFSYVGIAAVLRYAETREFSEAFNLTEIRNKISSYKFFAGWVGTVLIVIGLGILLNLIPVIGWIMGSAIIGIFQMTAMGEVYRQA